MISINITSLSDGLLMQSPRASGKFTDVFIERLRRSETVLLVMMVLGYLTYYSMKNVRKQPSMLEKSTTNSYFRICFSML